MALIYCEVCNGRVSEQADRCPHCGHPLEQVETLHQLSFSPITRLIREKTNTPVQKGLLMRYFWFALLNGAVVISLVIITQGAIISFIPYLLLASIFFPFIALMLSKWNAKRTHDMYMLDSNDLKNETEQSLYELVATLSEKAGLNKVPEVGIYESDDINAFATGATKNSSLVAFSSALIEEFDEESIAAIAAHEVAHIANGDMITMTLLQSVINAIVYVFTIPLTFIKWIAFFNNQISGTVYWLIVIVKFLVTTILLFLGSLVAKAYSRRREFKADALAGQLISPQAMIHALDSLRQCPAIVEASQKNYAAFKINGVNSWLDIFSTHPNLDRRIQRLSEQASDGSGTILPAR